MRKICFNCLSAFLFFACAGPSEDTNSSDEGGRVDSTMQNSNTLVEESGSTMVDAGYRVKGAKMYITSNDANAKEHFVNELQQYDTWVMVNSEEEAQYHIKLHEKMKKLDRQAWIDIVNTESGEVLYSSPHAKGLKKGIRTVNVKEQAIHNLVHTILAPEFFQ